MPSMYGFEYETGLGQSNPAPTASQIAEATRIVERMMAERYRDILYSDYLPSVSSPPRKKTVEEKIKELWMRSNYFKSLPVRQILPKTKTKGKPYYRVERW